MRALSKIETDLIKELVDKGFTVTELALYAKDFLLREAEEGDEFAEYQYSVIKNAFRKIYYNMD